MIAKAPSLNFVQFNGYYGCIQCYMRGIHQNHRRLYPCEEPFILRTPENFRKDALTAEREKHIVKGIKGRCFLDEIIEIPHDVPFDAMHQVFLGCAKSITTALVGSLTKRNQLTAEDRLKNIKSPRESHCKPKLLSELMYWKARYFKFFLFHFGSYCLEGLVKDEHHQSFSQLSLSIRLLSMQRITETYIKEAERLLGDFQKNFVKLYGADSQSFNFHSLRHLADQGCVFKNFRSKK